MFQKHIKYFLLIFYFCIIYSNHSFGIIIKEIKIKGNSRVSDNTITMFSGVSVNDNIEVENINLILKNIYDSNFFEDVNVVLKNDILIIKIIEKPIIESIIYSGIKSNELLEKIKSDRILKPRSSYDKINLKKDRKNILDSLKDSGFYFSQVDTSIVDLGDNNLDINFNITRGEKSKIKKISFLGNKIYKDKKLKNIIITEEYKFWKFISGKKFLNENLIQLDIRLLRNFYLNKGYHDVKINSSFAKLIDKNGFEIIYNIDPKNKFYFGEINLEITNDFEEDNFADILSFFKDLKGKPYSIYSIEKIIENIEIISLNEQFESVKVIPVENIISDTINLTFKIEENEKFFVERININGNNVTQESVIRNQLSIDEGDPFNEILYNKSINEIKNLNFFKQVEGEILNGSSANKKIININIEEKATGEISLGAGAGTSGATVGFSVKENNFLGRGIGFDTSLSLTPETIKGQFSVKNPNFNNTDKSVYFTLQAIEIDRSSDFGYKTNKTGFTTGTSFEYLDDFNLGIGLSNFYEKIVTDGSASALQKTQDGNYWDTFLNIDFDYDKRNQSFQPSDGFRSIYSLDLPVISDTSTLVNSYNFRHYNELYENNITTASFYFKSANSITGNNIKISERLFVPGNMLRGFEKGKIGPKDGDDFIGGNFITSANISTTLPQILESLQNIDLILFADAANVWGVDYDSTINETGNIRSSFGIGVDWMTPIGPLNFTFAQPITKENSDIVEEFRFNLGTTF